MKCAMFIDSVRLSHVHQAMAEPYRQTPGKLLSSCYPLFIPPNEQSLISDLTSWKAAY